MHWSSIYQKLRPAHFSFLAYAAQLGFGFITFLVLVRKSSMELFGWWVLMLSVVSMADQARTGLIQNGLIKWLKQYEERRKEVIGSALVLSMLASVLLIVLVLLVWKIYGLSAAWHGAAFTRVALLFAGGFLAQAYLRVRESILMSDLRFDRLFLVKLGSGLSLFLGVYLLREVELTSLLAIQVLSWCVGLLLLLFFPGVALAWRKSTFLELFHYGRFVMGTNLGSMIYNKMDVLILGSLLGPTAVGLYNAAYRLTNFAEVPLSSKAQVVFPQLARSVAQQDTAQLVRQYEWGLGKVLLLLTPLCLLLFAFAKSILVLVAGPEYAAGAMILQVLSLSVLLKPWGRFFGITLDAMNRPQLNFYFLLFWMLLNLALNILLVPVFGAIGVAMTTLLCVLSSAVVGQLILIKMIPISPRRVLMVGVKYIYKTKK